MIHLVPTTPVNRPTPHTQRVTNRRITAFERKMFHRTGVSMISRCCFVATRNLSSPFTVNDTTLRLDALRDCVYVLCRPSKWSFTLTSTSLDSKSEVAVKQMCKIWPFDTICRLFFCILVRCGCFLKFCNIQKFIEKEKMPLNCCDWRYRPDEN